MKITKYRNGRESYDFKISKEDMAKFVSGLVSSYIQDGIKPGYYWVNFKGEELIKLIVEESK
jgi:uncharacterized membrane protein